MSPRLLSFAWLAAVALGPSCLSHYQPTIPSEPGTRLSSTRAQTSEPARPVAAKAVVKALRRSAGSPMEASTLVAVCLGEARWTRPADCAAAWHVLQRYAARRRVSLRTAANTLVWSWSRPPRWIRNVRPSCGAPTGWPSRLSWPAHQPACRTLYGLASAFLRGELSDPCGASQPDGWRAPGPATRRALARGYERAACSGELANVFVKRRA